jgi:HSP20 family molecular chaperone IbpA
MKMGHGFHLEVAIPSVDRQDMNIVFEEGVLTVKGERNNRSTDNGRRYFAHQIG